MKKQTLLTIIAGGLLVLLLAGCGAVALENPFAIGDSKEPEEEGGYSLGLTLTPGDGQITATWNAYDGADMYEVWFGTSNDETNRELVQDTMDLDNTDTTCTITGLINEQIYYVWVYPSVIGEKKLIDQTPVSATPVGEYTLGLVLGAADSQITASWNVHDQADSYEVLYGTDNDLANATTAVSDLTTTSYTILNLDNGQLYYVWVFPIIDGVRQLENQIPLTETPVEAVSPPPAPNAQVRVQGFNGIYLFWDPVVGATSYRVTWQVDSETPQQATTSNTEYTIENLPLTDPTVTISVYAVNAVGDSPANDLGPRLYSFEVANVSVTSNVVSTAGTLTITWDEILDVDRYIISIYANGDSNTTDIDTGTSFSYTLDLSNFNINNGLYNTTTAGNEFSFTKDADQNRLYINVSAVNDTLGTVEAAAPTIEPIDLGAGTGVSPYLIFHEKDLRVFREGTYNTNVFTLMADISLTENAIDFGAGNTWNPVPGDFSGEFNGNNHTISNVVMEDLVPIDNLVGFFRLITGTVRDLTIQTVKITLANPNGRIIGTFGGQLSSNGLLENCHAIYSVPGDSYIGNSGTLTNQGQVIGGLLGRTISGNINNCSSSITIYGGGNGTASSPQQVGGLLGMCMGGPSETDSSSIDNSYATGNIYCNIDLTDSNDRVGVGGLVGICRQNTYITDSYATGNIISENVSNVLNAGGLIGLIDNITTSTYTDTITNCYATGSINNCTYSGGLVGAIKNGSTGSLTVTISQCYAEGNIGNSISSINIGGILGGIYFNGANPPIVTISRCLSTGNIESPESGVGGLVGYLADINQRVYDSYTTGSLTVNNIYAGGLIGYSNGVVYRNMSSRNVNNNNNFTGGLIGQANSGNIGSNLVVCSSVSATGSNNGRIYGTEGAPTAFNNYANSSLSTFSGGNSDGNDINILSDFMTATHAVYTYAGNEWDFTNVWYMSGEGPILRCFLPSSDGGTWDVGKPSGWIDISQDPIP